MNLFDKNIYEWTAYDISRAIKNEAIQPIEIANQYVEYIQEKDKSLIVSLRGNSDFEKSLYKSIFNKIILSLNMSCNVYMFLQSRHSKMHRIMEVIV
mgnify:CR=1 FL=1